MRVKVQVLQLHKVLSYDNIQPVKRKYQRKLSRKNVDSNEGT